MDPKTALDKVESCIASKAWIDAADYLSHYAAWRRNGGFEPQGGDRRYRDLIALLKGNTAAMRAIRRADCR